MFSPTLFTRKKTSLGFSLLELLVVISIIGILVAISAAAFTTAQKKSRDAKRRGDIKVMQNGFEQYNAQNNGAYGATCSVMVAIGGVTIFPGGLPVDPKTAASYTCTGDTTTYCICATLESGGGNTATADCNTIGIASTTNTFFCAKSLQ
jgi:prepilin-type N-terminal cleavage/methylation domain-containing protein